MKRKMSKFMKIYISVMVLLLILLIVAVFVLTSVLKSYESTRPKYEAERVFNEYFKKMNISGLMLDANEEVALFESGDDVNSSIAELYNPETLKCFAVTADDNNTAKYAVTADGKLIAYFTLRELDEVKYGFKNYKLSSAQLLFDGYGDITIRVPTGYLPFVNSVAVPDVYKTGSNIESDSCKYMPEGTSGIKYDEYKIDGLLKEPIVTAKAPNMNEVAVTYDLVQDVFTASVLFSQELEDTYKVNMISAARAYTAYMSNDGSFAAVSKYLDKSSDIYQKVRTSEVNWVRKHEGFDITDEKAFEFYGYSDEVFSCRVTLKETLYRAGKANHIENIDLIFYVRVSEGKPLIYDIVTNN
jgi:hypothetical protein